MASTADATDACAVIMTTSVPAETSSQLPEYAQTIQARQPDIHQGDIGAVLLRQADALLAGAGDGRGVPVVLQVRADGIPENRLVFHDQDEG